MVSITHDEAVSILKAVKETALLRIEKNAISATTDDDEEEEEEVDDEVCVCMWWILNVIAFGVKY